MVCRIKILPIKYTVLKTAEKVNIILPFTKKDKRKNKNQQGVTA